MAPKRKESGCFSLLIELGNDAMQTSQDVAAALRKVAARLEENDYPCETREYILRGISDGNGNLVGQWRIGSPR